MSPYPETPQQEKVKIGGLLVRRVCTGKKGSEFFECRSEVLKCAFDETKCEGELKVLRGEALKELESEG